MSVLFDHVQAILVALVPLGVFALRAQEDATQFFRIAGLGIYALFPLFTHPRETPTKALLYLTFMRAVYLVIQNRFSVKQSFAIVGQFEKVYGIALLALFVFGEVVHPLFMAPKGFMEFLPCMLVSVTCASGIFVCWLTSAIRLVKDALSV